MEAVGKKKQDRSGFTLLELLAVIMIAGLLAAVSVPTFNSLLKGTALNTAATALTDTLALARQFAIANRVHCHVELVDKPTLQQAADEIQYNSYRVYYVDRDGKEITVRDWKLLPRFVVFDDDNPPPEEIVFKPTGGAYELPSGSQWPRNFLVVQAEPQGDEKVMTVKVDGFTGRAKSEAGDTTSKP